MGSKGAKKSRSPHLRVHAVAVWFMPRTNMHRIAHKTRRGR